MYGLVVISDCIIRYILINMIHSYETEQEV